MLDIKLQSSPLKYKWFGFSVSCSVSFIACEQALRGTLVASFLSAVIHYLVITPGPSATLRSYQLQR